MKKRNVLALLLSLLLVLSGCGAGQTQTPPPAEGETAGQPETREPAQPEGEQPIGEEGGTFRAAALRGPTAMGMVSMMAADSLDSFTLAGSADEITPLLIKGDLDIACVPANLASVLYNKTEGQIVCLAVNTLGVLNIVELGESVQSLADLKGKTIVSAGKGSTPEYGLRYLLKENGLDPDKDVTIDWKSEHSECVAALASGAASIAMLPQPFATAAKGKLPDLRVASDLTEEWAALDNGSAMITGVAAARRDFVEEHPETVERFLKEYRASVDWVNANTAEAGALIAELGILESADMAAKALPYCNIVCITGAEQKEKLSGYLQVLADTEPASVGGALPGDDFFYGA